MSNVLVIAPHMDDEVLGCGATLARHVEQGDHVSVVMVANRAYGHRYDEALIAQEKAAAQRAQRILGYQAAYFLDLPDERLDGCLQDVLIPLEKVYDEVSPQVVYVNHGGDMNQDHKAVFHAAMIVVRPHGGRPPQLVLAYESPSASDQAFPLAQYAFLPNYYVEVSATLERKVEALRQYERESRAFPHPRSPEALRAYAQKRGTEIGFAAAEAFQLLRAKTPAASALGVPPAR